VALGEQGPFLGEAEGPAPPPRVVVTLLSLQAGKNMLHDPGLLVVRFLDEEAIICDPINRSCLCRLDYRCQSSPWRAQSSAINR